MCQQPTSRRRGALLIHSTSFKEQNRKKNEWLVAFKEGVNLADKVVSDTFGDQIGEDFMARYDLTFLSPKSQAMRCKASLLLSPF